MTFAEIASDLVYHLHVPLSIVAGLDDAQIRSVYFRKRNKYGTLVTVAEKAPSGRKKIGKPASFKEMFWAAKSFQGLENDQIEKAWAEYLVKNPKLAERMADRKRQNPFED